MLRVLLSVASLALLATAQSDERVIAVRSLQPFLGASLQSDQGMQSALPTEDTGIAKDATIRGARAGKSDWLTKLLKDRHRIEIENDDLTLATDSNVRVAISGKKGAVNACLADIDSIAATLTRSIEITAYELPVPNGKLPPAFIDGKSLQSALDTATPRWSARAATRSGGSVHLGDVQWTNYMRDQDAEVAEKSLILDPKVDNLFQGTRVSLTVHALPNEELLLRGSWLTSERLGMEIAEIGKNRATVHLPHHRTAHINFGGRIDNGAGLVVSARRKADNGMEFVFVVRARYISPPPQRANNLFVFPITAWQDATDTAWDMKAGPFVGNDSDGRHPIIEERPLLSPTDLAMFLAPGGNAIQAGGVLVVHDNAAICARAEAALQQLVDAQLSQAELRVNQTQTNATSIVQPLLANMQSRAFIGTERSVIGDHEVEIASKAGISNPVVFIMRAGVWSRVAGHSMGRNWNIEGLWSTATQLAVHQHNQVGTPPMSMQLPDYKMASWPWDGQMAVNQPQVLAPNFSVLVKTQ